MDLGDRAGLYEESNLKTISLVLFQTVYDTWFITCYNLIYTSLPVLGLSLFEKVRPGSRALRQGWNPGLTDEEGNERELSKVKCEENNF